MEISFLMLSKFRGSIVGAIVGDCIGGIQETMSSPITFAEVAAVSDPLSLRSKLVRSGDRHIFRFSADTLAVLSAARSVAKLKHGHIERAGITEDFRSSLFDSLSRRGGVHRPPSSGLIGSEIHDKIFDADKYKFQGNCSVVRAIPCGLIDPTIAPLLALATHTHANATESSETLANLIKNIVYSGNYVISDPSRIIQSAVSIANEPLDEEGLRAQEIFYQRIGSKATASVALAAGYFGFLRAVFMEKNPTDNFPFPAHLQNLQPSERKVNLYGNSNRLDSSRAFDRESAFAYTESPFSNAINWAISLGGDTRSNACVAGGLAGAYWGESEIPEVWRTFCEGTSEGVEVAEALLK